jgi:hypothetical protein
VASGVDAPLSKRSFGERFLRVKILSGISVMGMPKNLSLCVRSLKFDLFRFFKAEPVGYILVHDYKLQAWRGLQKHCH